MSEIELILKSPTDRIAPFSIKCQTLWTIKQLKIHIKDIYPCKPTIESQKVIYVGKLLKDDQLLKDIFEVGSSTIVHFICQSSLIEPEKEIKDNKEKAEITAEKYPELYKEYENYINNFYSSTCQSFAAMNQYQQMMWINQAYMQSYANYYAQFNNKNENIMQNGVSSDIIQQPAVANNEQASQSAAAAQNQENVANNDRRIDGAGENGMQNMMAAAFGGLMGDGGEDENDGEVEPRDILHYFYILVRFGLLLLICYYYSSVVSVITTLMLFFLFFGVNLVRRNNGGNGRIITPAVVVIPEQSDQPNVINTQIDTTSSTTLETATINDNDEDNNIVITNKATNNGETTTDINIIAQTQSTNDNIILPTITERLKQAANTSLQFVFTFFVTLFPEPIAQMEIN